MADDAPQSNPTSTSDTAAPSSRSEREKRKQTGRRQRAVLLAIASFLVVFVASLLIVPTILPEATEDGGLEFVIEEGAAENLDIPTIDYAINIPTDIEFGPDDVAVLTIRNEDTVANRAGPWVIGPGQTYTARFTNPGVYQYDCSVDPAGSVTITVHDG